VLAIAAARGEDLRSEDSIAASLGLCQIADKINGKYIGGVKLMFPSTMNESDGFTIIDSYEEFSIRVQTPSVMGWLLRRSTSEKKKNSSTSREK